MASSSLLLYALKHLAAEAFFYQTYHGEEKLRSAFTYLLLHRAEKKGSCFAKRVPKILLKEGVVVLAVSIKIVTVQGGTETGVQSSINLNVYKI